MDGPRNSHAKQSKSERGRQIPQDITYMWNLKQDTNALSYERLTRTDLWFPKGGRRQQVGGGKVWEFEISRCKLVYTEWITDVVLLYSTGSHIQHLVINRNGKEYDKQRINPGLPRCRQTA